MITKYQKEQTVTRLKKAYSSLSQTTQKAIADNGPITTWEVTHGDGQAFFTKYLKPYLSVLKDCGYEEYSENGTCWFQFHALNTPNLLQQLGAPYYKFVLNDGTLIAIAPNVKTTSSTVGMFIDINGNKKPNIAGKDIFIYTYKIKSDDLSIQGKIIPNYWSNNRQELLNRCNKNANGQSCAALIMSDGWRIADDYPW